MQNLKRSDFYFDLLTERIAKHPLSQRDASRLLVFRDDRIRDQRFHQLGDELPGDCLLVFNNAKVIPARLFFKRATGATIELLLLEPHGSTYEEVFHRSDRVQWKCMVGNLKKWKESEELLHAGGLDLRARLLDRDERVVELSWTGGEPFAHLLDLAGRLPIPPYLERDTEERDYREYQTIYAKKDGSVAAPTAGLHFTEALRSDLKEKGIGQTELTLHVGAGTFLPVKDETVLDHPMHREHFEVSLEALRQIMGNPVRVAVGTTSLRVLESLYYLGVQMTEGKDAKMVGRFEPYEVSSPLSYEDALGRIISHLEETGSDRLRAATEIMILPEYRLKSIRALLTNFHLPESTLLMLVASVVGDRWKAIYQFALENDYRFLSYGDSSLLFVK